MRKILLTQLTILLATFCFGQHFSSSTTKSEIKFSSKENLPTEQKNATVEFYFNKKSNQNEIKLTINRIIRHIKPFHKESIDADTLTYEGDQYVVDTDSLSPQGEDEKSVLENLLLFTSKPIIFKEDDGTFKGPKIRMGSPNIELFFYSKLPVLNKNGFLTPLLLNIDTQLNSKIDTVISEINNGIFITTYTKAQGGYKIKGRYVPLKKPVQEENLNYATTIIELFDYDGKIETVAEKIKNMDISVRFKSKVLVNSVQINSSKETFYKIAVSNN
jgi:hypothetical protein